MGKRQRKYKMRRILDFGGVRGSKRFELIRLSLLQAGDSKGERTREIIRKEARLLDALDSISILAPTDADREFRVLVSDVNPEPILISQEDFELLSSYVDKTPWIPRASRDAVDLYDWLSSAEKVEEAK